MSNNLSLVEVLAWIGAILVAILLVVCLVAWLMWLSNRESPQQVTRVEKTKVEKTKRVNDIQIDEEYLRELEEAQRIYNKPEPVVVTQQPEPVIIKEPEPVQEQRNDPISKEAIQERQQMVYDEFKEEPKREDDARDFFKDMGSDDAGEFFKEEENTDFDAFQFEEEEKQEPKEDERFDKILDALRKNADDKEVEPAIERELIENITRGQVSELLKEKEAEAALLANEKDKEDEMSKLLEEINALKAELEKEREELAREKDALRREETDKLKSELEALRREIDKEPVAVAVKPENEEVTALRRELEKQYAMFQDIIDRQHVEIRELKVQDRVIRSELDTPVVNNGDTSELSILIAQLIEERKIAREETEKLKNELEQERKDAQKKLEEQFKILKDELADNQIEALKQEYQINVNLLQDKYDLLKREMEMQTQEALRCSEDAEKQLQEQKDLMKIQIAEDAKDLATRNEELERELKKVMSENKKIKSNTDEMIEVERARLQEQIKEEYEENQKMLNEKYMQLSTELEREGKLLAEKREELAKEREALMKSQERLENSQENLSQQNSEEMEKLQSEKDKLKAELEEMRNVMVSHEATGADAEMIRLQLQREFEEKEMTLKLKYQEMQEMLSREEENIRTRKEELLVKEQEIEQESIRIQEASLHVDTLITEKVYTREERNRILMDYRSKIDVLRERLRINERAIRDNNKEFIPLRRIKDTLERDLKLLRKREAIVAKQQVLLYGVNNITELNPERIKKLEQDVQQLSGLQQSVANCEDILSKNRDRYPTLENLSRVLTQQNKQLLSDIEELEQAISFFETSATTE